MPCAIQKKFIDTDTLGDVMMIAIRAVIVQELSLVCILFHEFRVSTRLVEYMRWIDRLNEWKAWYRRKEQEEMAHDRQESG